MKGEENFDSCHANSHRKKAEAAKLGYRDKLLWTYNDEADKLAAAGAKEWVITSGVHSHLQKEKKTCMAVQYMMIQIVKARSEAKKQWADDEHKGKAIEMSKKATQMQAEMEILAEQEDLGYVSEEDPWAEAIAAPSTPVAKAKAGEAGKRTRLRSKTKVEEEKGVRASIAGPESHDEKASEAAAACAAISQKDLMTARRDEIFEHFN